MCGQSAPAVPDDHGGVCQDLRSPRSPFPLRALRLVQFPRCSALPDLGPGRLTRTRTAPWPRGRPLDLKSEGRPSSKRPADEIGRERQPWQRLGGVAANQDARLRSQSASLITAEAPNLWPWASGPPWELWTSRSPATRQARRPTARFTVCSASVQSRAPVRPGACKSVAHAPSADDGSPALAITVQVPSAKGPGSL